ncbi:hypothetical protein EV363DRAFT_1443555 [Boletus edulis]|nr:hypothetical protein EV363DRAFT_1455626 [Boletus edulis]KAF8141644.1 hypothetical protein EV363DRAFT_1443555 [Boletus edulis]
MALRLIEPVGEVINLEISGVHSEWTMYCFEIDINSPGKKIIAFRVKEDPFKAKSTDPDTENKADDSETIRVTATECRILGRVARRIPDDTEGCIGSLHVTEYITRPITGPGETVEEVLERAWRKRVKLSD